MRRDLLLLREMRDVRFPGIAWADATRLRNRIVHGYWEIDLDALVATAVDDLPEMITSLNEAIDISGEG